MEKVDLKLFCCPDPDRKAMTEPWTVGEFTYTTNGHIMIRVPRVQDVGGDGGIDLSKINKVFETEPAAWFAVQPLTVVPDTCPQCHGKGKIFTCPECEGEGEVCACTDFNDYDGIDCISCGGDGQVTKEKWEAMMSRRIRLGQSTAEADSNCSRCGGTGTVWPKTGTTYGAAYFADHLLAMIAGFPEVEIGPFGELDIARFRFNGGEGAIMPLRR